MDKKQPTHPTLSILLSGLKKMHLRITEPRKAVIQTLLENHGPFTAEEIYKRFLKSTCDLATVYRSLTSLEEAGITRRVEFGDGCARFELSDNHHHHHVVCKECKKIEVLDDCELDEINKFARKRGFSSVSHSLEFFGICPSCK